MRHGDLLVYYLRYTLLCNMPNGAKYEYLSAISVVRTGLTLRNEFRLQEKGNVAVLQPRDISDGRLINIPFCIDVPLYSLSQHLLSENDLLIGNKGQKFGTFLYSNEFLNSVASASFFVIKMNKEKCLPEFLQWYLNQKQTRDYLLQNSITATIPSLSKAVLTNLQVPIPSLSVQKKITHLIGLVKAEQLLLKEIVDKNEEYRDSYVWEMINQ